MKLACVAWANNALDGAYTAILLRKTQFEGTLLVKVKLLMVMFLEVFFTDSSFYI
jgi:hypothetical protein